MNMNSKLLVVEQIVGWMIVVYAVSIMLGV